MLLLCSCLFGVFISHSGASVSLGIHGGLSSFQDGTDVILICTISPYNNVMTWYVDNDSYADCFLGSCGATPNKPYTFIFNFDESNGEFRLTIKSVNSSHAGLLFACDDGNERKTKSFHVTTKENSVATDDNGCEIDIKETLFFVLMSVTRIYAIQIVLSHTIYKYVKEYIGTGKSCTTCIIVLFSSLPILGFIPLLIWFKCVSFCEKVTIKWSWKKTIKTIVATVALIVVGEPSVIYILVYVKYLTQPVTVFVLFGLSIIMVVLEILICVFICQDNNGDLQFAAVIVNTIILLFSVSFLVGCLWCYDDSNKYCCSQNQVSACNLQNNVAEGSQQTRDVEVHFMSGANSKKMSHDTANLIQHIKDVLQHQPIAGNSFVCSYCKGDNMFPVVCLDLLSRKFLCANCFKSKILAKILPKIPLQHKEVSVKIGKITNDADHLQFYKDKGHSCTKEVYCLVCKLIVCRTCFNRHTESCIWDKKT